MLNAYEKHLKIKSPQLPNDYAINLMWLNRTLDETKPFIDSSTTEEDLVKNFLSKANKWKETNPNAEVAIWFDSKFVSSQALINTRMVLEKQGFNIKLKDIQDIDIVKNNPDAFSDNIPIYYRVDLMKLIISLHSIVSESKQATIFADLEVGELRKSNGKTTERMTPEELFSADIMEKLNEIGLLVISNSGYLENQFLQLINKPETIEALKVFINANLSRAITSLNLIANEQTKVAMLTGVGNAVYGTMMNQLFPLIAGTINKNIKVNAKLFDKNAPDELIDYDLKKHGSLPLGNAYLERGNVVCVTDGFNPPTSWGQASFSKFIKFSDSVGVEMGRDDLDTRVGHSHTEDMENLVARKPADGSAIYKCKHLEIGSTPTHEPQRKMGRSM